MSRYQFVWWGWHPRDWNFSFGRFTSALRTIYAWHLNLGPLEVRRWAR